MENSLADDLLKGAGRIGAFTGDPPRRVYYLASTTDFPCFRIGSTIHARKSKILAWYEALEASAAEAPGDATTVPATDEEDDEAANDDEPP